MAGQRSGGGKGKGGKAGERGQRSRRGGPGKRGKGVPASARERALSHELEVNQEELETQNRQLVESQRLLEDSRDGLSSLYDFAPLPYVTFCDQGIIRGINLRGAAILGQVRERLIGRPLLLFVDEKYRRPFLNHLARCRRGEAPRVVELVVVGEGKARVAVEVHTSTWEMGSSGERQHLAVLIDMTERNRREEERKRLRETAPGERLLLMMLETLPVAVRMMDAGGEPLMFNERCREVWGIARGAPLPEWELQKGWTPGTQLPLRTTDWPAARVLATGEAVLRERIDTEGFDGVRRRVIQSAVPRVDEDGAVVGVVEVTEDVTRLLEAQDAARRRQEQLEAAFDAAHLSFWDWEVQRNRVTWSGPFEEYFARSQESGTTRLQDLLERIHEEDRWAVQSAVEKSRENRGVFELEFRLSGNEGEIRWLSAKGRFFYHQDSPVRMTGVVRDITAQKQAEVQLRQAKEAAEEASRVKDDFLATVSHELRTPLSAILLWAHLARTRLNPGEEVARALETIQRSAKAQSQIIEDLLDISRGITGKLRLNLRMTALAPAVEAALEAVRPAVEAKQITLEVSLSPEVPPVQVDPDRIQQVAWNLLTNAIKFTRPGGRVTVTLGTHHPEGNDGPAMARLVVSDTGQGITAEFLPHIFERFRQAESGSTRIYGGLGLGMAIARELVQMHGGTIHAESGGLGQGATFIVDLPLAGATGAEGGEAAPGPGGASLRGVKVLLVEDEESAREALGQVLETAGAAVRTAASAVAALHEFESAAPDVLVSDIAMPGQDGYSMLREIRALEDARGGGRGAEDREGEAGNRERAWTPAVALTARARAEDRAESMAAGYQAHLTKPVEPGELIATVAGLVNGK